MRIRFAAALFMATTALAAAVPAGPGGAEPQALGLVATEAPAALQCKYGRCDTFLSAFCLEQRRPSPYKRTAYRATAGTDITLVVTTRDGRTLRLPGGEWLTFRSNYIYASVLASVDRERLARLAPVRAGVEVGPLAVLVPVPIAGDPEPHDADELALAAGAYRRAAEAFFGTAGARSERVALTARLINALPRFGRLAAERRDRAIAGAMSEAAFSRARPSARRAVADTVRNCRAAVAVNRKMNLRACLEVDHGGRQIEINDAFWKSLGGV